jgi:hypothetical protein
MDPQCNPSVFPPRWNKWDTLLRLVFLLIRSLLYHNVMAKVESCEGEHNSPDFSEFAPCAFQFCITTA